MDEYMLLYAKPSKDDFFGLVEGKLKEAKLEDSSIVAAMTALRDAIKVPYPYFPQPQATGGTAELQKKIDDLTAEKADLESKLAQKTTELGTKTSEYDVLKAENSSLSTTLESIRKDEIAAILGRIKEVDKDFTETELLEGVECLDSRKTLLTKYLGSMVKLAGKTNFSVDATSVTEDRISKVLLDMGISDVKKFVERK